jgi:hypothetical protein
MPNRPKDADMTYPTFIQLIEKAIKLYIQLLSNFRESQSGN